MAQQSSPIQVLPATTDDIMMIIDLAHRIWPVSYADQLTPEQIANMLRLIYSEENLLQEMKDGHRFWKAQNSETTIGFVSAYQQDAILWIKKLYVLPDMQGQGIGTLLMNAARAAFSSANEVRLLTNRKNYPAQAFYIRQGFIKIDEVPVQMGDFHFIDYVYAKPLAR